jgi:hypothetical protein
MGSAGKDGIQIDNAGGRGGNVSDLRKWPIDGHFRGCE